MPAYAAAIPRPPRTLTELEQATPLKVTGDHRDGFRDHVIFAVALGTGLREHEIAALDVGDVLHEHGRVRRRIALLTNRLSAARARLSSDRYELRFCLTGHTCGNGYGWSRTLDRSAWKSRSMEQPRRSLAYPMNQQTPDIFLHSVYFGDRACKSIYIDCWKREVHIEIDQISRIRDPTGRWNFYADEDIVDGRLVFTSVKSVRFDPGGPIPNDYINEVSALPSATGDGAWVFKIFIDSTGTDGTVEVLMEVIAADVHLEDPKHPGVKIRS
jgi:hypothetical protein